MDLSLNIDSAMLEALQVRADALGQDVNDFIADLLATHDDADASVVDDDLVFYGRLLESVGQAVIATDLHRMVIHWDGAAETLYGWTVNEAIGRQLSTLIGFKLSEADQQERLATLRDGDDWLREHYVTHRNGRRFPALFTDHAITDADDRVIGIISVSTDISKLKTLQTDFQRNEVRLRSILDSQTAYVTRVDLKNRYTYVNAAFEAQFGWSSEKDTLVGTPAGYGTHPDDVGKMADAARWCYKNPGKTATVALRKQTASGDYLWIRWESVGLSDEQGQVFEFQCTGKDITREKVIERALIEAQELYHLIATYSRDAISIHTPDGRYLYMNPYGEQLYGYTTDELMTLTQEEREALVHPDDIQRTRDEAHKQALAGEEVTRVAYRLRCKNGRYVWVESAAVPIFDEDGEIERILSTTRNITERKQAEMMVLENERLRGQFQAEQNRNKLVRDIMSTFNHDVRTSLTIIMTARDSLKRYHDLLTKDQRDKKLDAIGRHVQVATSLLDDVILLRNEGEAIRERYNPQRVNLATLCCVSVDEMQTNTTKHTLSFVQETDRSEFVVDEVLMSRILLNLLSNAIKYSPAGGQVQLTLAVENDDMVLRIKDEGLGIPDDKRVAIFDTNFRLPSHESIDGTGLGLSIVRDCVQLHDGTIAVKSTLGEGSTFIIRLPIRE
ncbi:MAG: PAS domain S-box protein [Chloroflexota bacterium]